jgi:transposase
METNRRYDDEFKRNAVELLISSGRPLKVLAKELGVTPESLRAWRKAHLRSPIPLGDRPPRGPTPRAIYEELRQLQKENAHLKEQRDILKKALRILSDPPIGGMR